MYNSFNQLDPNSSDFVVEAQWDFKLRNNSKSTSISFENSDFTVYKTFFKDSLCLQKLADLDAKGAKNSVKIWATNFNNSLFKNISLYMSRRCTSTYMNVRLSKIQSVHTYVIPRTVYFGWICILHKLWIWLS